jgi:DNA invertase Pin-like site-specific DNA recombinase
MKAFAAYIRCSTEDQQDPQSSRAWQLRRAEQLIEPAGGVIVAEFFDVGLSRSLPWKRRPEANRLLESFKNPVRGFDAVVIGEPARAFYGAQYELTFPLFEHFGVELWVPDVPGGRVDPDSEGYELMMSIFGTMGKSERRRIKVRVRAAMAAQAATEGRFLGGRPPYGYTLADAGPHPNPSKSAAGQRAHRLELDPTTSPIARRIFVEYLAGSGIHAIAEGLNRDRVPSPSAHDRARNRHRTGVGWSKWAVRAILMNARYTGREVWNRQRRHEQLVNVDDTALGHETKLKWNDRADWIWSAVQTHDAIITSEEYAAVQEHLGAGANRPANRQPRRTSRPYMLRGLLFCDACGRRMQGSWNHGRAHYRCRFPAQYAGVKDEAHRSTIYLREDVVVPALDGWLADLFHPDRIDKTVAQLLEVARPSEEDTARVEAAKRSLDDCEKRLAKYRTALENGADPTVVATWIAEVQGQRLAASRELADASRADADEPSIREMIENVGPIVVALAAADATKKAALYRDLGLSLIYRAADDVVLVEARPRVRKSVSEGGLVP